MIALTRLNDKRFVLNAELIRTIEENPDTTLTLISGERILVKESMEDVVRKSVEYGRHLRSFLPRT